MTARRGPEALAPRERRALVSPWPRRRARPHPQPFERKPRRGRWRAPGGVRAHVPEQERSEPRDAARLWEAALGRLQIEVSRANFETWLRGTRALAREGGALTVEAGSAFRADWLNGNLAALASHCVSELAREPLSARFVAPGAARGGERTATAAAPANADEPAALGRINRAFTLKRYFRSHGNALALDGCLGLVGEAEPAAPAISPVVVHGEPGAGKTHLLHGIARAARERGWPVACLSGEGFTMRYQRALRDGAVEAFQDAVRGVRLLIVDDLHDLVGKQGTLRELLHTLDAVAHAGGGAALGSEARPRELGLPERLSSRLEAGLVANVTPFAPAERRAFIEARLRELRLALPPWCIDQLASRPGPARATLGNVHAAAALQRQGELDELRLAAALGAAELRECGMETAKAAIARIAAHFALAAGELEGRARTREATRARAVAAAALREGGRSHAEVGALLGGRARGTAVGLAERGRDLAANDPALAALLRAG